VQLSQGFTGIDIGQYLFQLFVLQFSGDVLLAVLAFAVHVVVNNKYLGHFVVGIVVLVISRLPAFGFEDRLYLYGSSPSLVYSDMNGWGHFLPAVLWFRLYWLAFAALLLVAPYALWVRGREAGWRRRIAAGAARLRGPAWAIAGIAGLAFAATASWIFYNTHVLNPYVTRNDRQRDQAEYEKRYKALAATPQPRITAVDVRVDLFPAQNRARIAGTMSLVNKSGAPIRDVYVVYPTKAVVHAMSFGVPSRLADSAADLHWHHYVLSDALAPGATTEFRFDLEYGARGFGQRRRRPDRARQRQLPQRRPQPETTLMPSFGYAEDAELSSDRDRKEFGLAPKPRMHDLADPAMAMRNALSRDADFIDYRARFCTAADQLPVTSGYVEKDTTENGRRCIDYRMDAKMADIYSFVSARYEVGATSGTARRATSRSRSTTSAATNTTSTGWSPASRIRSPTSRPTGALPAQDRPHHRVPALLARRRLRRVVPEHGAVQRGDRLHRQGQRPRPAGHRLPVLRDRARGRASMVGAPGDAGQRAGRRVHHREPGRVLGADGAQAEVRRRQDAPLPQVRARPLPARPRHGDKQEQPLVRADGAPTCTTRRAR
jgi:hypothetical protein